jgi:ABC-type multidrug transport system fused ATPase/permease subunit
LQGITRSRLRHLGPPCGLRVESVAGEVLIEDVPPRLRLGEVVQKEHVGVTDREGRWHGYANFIVVPVVNERGGDDARDLHATEAGREDASWHCFGSYRSIGAGVRFLRQCVSRNTREAQSCNRGLRESYSRRETLVAHARAGPPMIEITGLTKRFGDQVAVDDLSFTAPAGQVSALLGPNGAGKTTTFRMLLGLARPAAGRALIDGRPYVELDSPRQTVGAVLESSGFHRARTGRDHLRVIATAAGIPRSGCLPARL